MGSRACAAAAGNHWLFGGYGLDNGNSSDLTQQQYLNDLWIF
jgi:hypothetical protein